MIFDSVKMSYVFFWYKNRFLAILHKEQKYDISDFLVRNL